MARVRAQQPAAITEVPVNLIPGNLDVLADFRTHHPSKMGSKLQINRTTGQFSRVSGIKAAWRRTDQDSLTNAVNYNLVEQMFVSAISLISKNESKKTNILPYELRKKIFDGLSGYHDLVYYGYRNRDNYDAMIQSINSIQNLLISTIRKNHFNMWYSEPAPLGGIGLSQNQYSDDAGEGICFGICTDWCRRWVLKGKSSLQQSKHNAPGQFEIDQWLLDRITRKGAYMHFPQIAQGFIKEGGNIADGIRALEKEKTQLENSIAISQFNLLIAPVPEVNPGRGQLTKDNQERLDNINLALSHFNKIKGPTSDNAAVFQSASLKYENLKSTPLNKYNIKDSLHRFGYLCDTEVFKPLFTGIMMEISQVSTDYFKKSHIAGNNGQNQISSRTAYIITWNTKEHMNLKKESGHALAFHISHENGKEQLRVFDPNFAEINCRDINDAIFIFSFWFSIYSVTRCLNEISVFKLFS